MGLSMHSNSHLGVSLMAMTHVAAACPNLTYACDTHYPWQTAEDEMVGRAHPFRQRRVRIPDRPGLGVDWITAELARGRERYEKIPSASATMKPKCGNTSIPWKRVLPRW